VQGIKQLRQRRDRRHGTQEKRNRVLQNSVIRDYVIINICHLKLYQLSLSASFWFLDISPASAVFSFMYFLFFLLIIVLFIIRLNMTLNLDPRWSVCVSQ